RCMAPTRRCSDGEAALVREKERLAEIAAAQERTGRLQLRARRTLVAMAALIVVGLGLAFWQYRASAARQVQLDRMHAELLPDLAERKRLDGDSAGAMRLSVLATRLVLKLGPDFYPGHPRSRTELAAAFGSSDWRLTLAPDDDNRITSATFSFDDSRIVTASTDKTARIWDAAT